MVTCFMIQAVGVGTFVTYGVFFDFLLDEFGWSRAIISGASSLAFLLSGLFAVVVGRLSDSFGPRLLMKAAALFFGTGFMLMSQVREVWQLYLFYGVIFGIGLSAIDVIALTTTARWFSTARGFMTGIVKVGTGAGQFTIPFLASVLIAAYGWRASYVMIGAGALILLFFLGTMLSICPEDSSIDVSPDSNNQSIVHLSQRSLTVAQAMRTRQMWIICGSYLSLVFCLLIVLVHIVPHATDIGLSHAKAAGILSTIGAVSMVGRFLSGIAIDRVGSKIIMLIWFFVLIASLVWLQFAGAVWSLYLFGAVYGLAHGGFFTAISPIVAEVFGVLAHGGIFGVVVFTGTVGGAIGPVLAGKMFDLSGSYDTVFLMITCMGVLSGILMLLLKPIQEKTEECKNEIDSLQSHDVAGVQKG